MKLNLIEYMIIRPRRFALGYFLDELGITV